MKGARGNQDGGGPGDPGGPAAGALPDPLADPLLDGVELRHLRGFLAVAEERSFTHAAARLRTGQPTLTRAVRALETALGVRLLDRTTRRVALTDAGRRLHADLAPLLPRLTAALRSPAGPALLRLGFTALLPAACRALIDRFEAATGAGVRLVRRDTPLAGLETGESDVAVVRGPVPADAGLRTALLHHEPRVAAVPRTAGPGALARRRVLDWAELAELPLVVNTVTGTTRPELWPAGRRPRLTCTADNVDEWLEAVAAGHGIGVAPEPVAARHPHPGIRYVRLKNAPPVPVHLALPARDAHPLAARFLAQAAPPRP
ncbi:LysR family transcriptional regulator [Streptomyces sp. RS10V-4]|uniref:LysR family transcriptional regulator n=1 Tax=Streptomyces rhizoryzae TaxID=2932493 RepID=UPI0020036178|nr:LysR family transcriptional regulator [Streptomyces rhizoryzae]MCK7623933.1 LysR family transcriptional regulator [Streptomyces rhizoryzae]